MQSHDQNSTFSLRESRNPENAVFATPNIHDPQLPFRLVYRTIIHQKSVYSNFTVDWESQEVQKNAESPQGLKS